MLVFKQYFYNLKVVYGVCVQGFCISRFKYYIDRQHLLNNSPLTNIPAQPPVFFSVKCKTMRIENFMIMTGRVGGGLCKLAANFPLKTNADA